MKRENTMPFIIKQLEEALEERQNPDRRKKDKGFEGHANTERRKGDRRSEREHLAAQAISH